MSIIRLLVVTFLITHSVGATVHSVPSSYSTIASAVVAASSGDTVSVAAGTFAELITINKSVKIIGAGQQTIIKGSLTISASNVTCKEFKVQGTGNDGIASSGVTNLSLINVSSYGNAVYGGSLSNISSLTISGATFTDNGNHGLSIVNCTNVTLTNVTADSNSQMGIQLYNVNGTNVISNTTARKNAKHGLFIYYGSSGVTVNGGTFSNNGINQHYDGGGIAVDAGSNKSVSGITINGPITAENNETAGIWVTASASTDTVKNIVIGQSGTVSLSSNKDGGVIIYGNVHSSTITAQMTKGDQSAAGILVLGINTSGQLSPQSTVINHSTFNGYTSAYPAITLSSGIGKNSSANVTGTGNTFAGFLDSASIESVVFHKPDNASLGTVTLTNNNPLPVELMSFSASRLLPGVLLQWETATESDNYGFEIERKNSKDRHPLWQKVGFVNGHGTTNTHHRYVFHDKTGEPGPVEYRLKQIDRDGSYEYSSSINFLERNNSPDSTNSIEIFPNPFNAMATIIARFVGTGSVRIALFDVTGKEIKTIYSGEAAGANSIKVKFDAHSLASGIYYCVLHHGSAQIVKKIALIK